MTKINGADDPVAIIQAQLDALVALHGAAIATTLISFADGHQVRIDARGGLDYGHGRRCTDELSLH